MAFLRVAFLVTVKFLEGNGKCNYTWIFENRVSKNINLTHSTAWQFKTIKFIQRPIKIPYLTPDSTLMVPRSIPTSPNLK